MKEMIYESWGTLEKEGPLLLCHDNYKGYEFYIISYRTHPCAYIFLNDHDTFFGKREEECAEISCHGGITYSDCYLCMEPVFVSVSDGVWVIGWDYAHYGDRFGNRMGKEWTTQEIYDEVWDEKKLQYKDKWKP